MALLIIYESFEGQTRKIAEFAKSEARKAGLDVAMVNTGDLSGPVSFDGIDKVILAAPVHEKRHPRNFESFLSENLAALKEPKTLMLSVSLNAAFPEVADEAREHLLEMKMRTGFEPDSEALVAGAARPSKSDYYSSQVLQHVLLRNRDYDPKKGDHEFTDWDALRQTLAAFLLAKDGSV